MKYLSSKVVENVESDNRFVISHHLREKSRRTRDFSYHSSRNRAAFQNMKNHRKSLLHIGQKESKNPTLAPNRDDMRKARKKSELRHEHFNFMKTLFQSQIADKRLKKHIPASVLPF